MDQRRLEQALLVNLETWIEHVEEIERHADFGNKTRALHLVRNMKQAHMAITRLMSSPLPLHHPCSGCPIAKGMQTTDYYGNPKHGDLHHVESAEPQ